MNVGQQLIVDVYQCNENYLESEVIVKQLIETISRKLNATIIELFMHHFSPYGLSCIAQISKSHVAIHTWPENKYAAIDIFSCSSVMENEELSLIITAFLGSRHIEIYKLERGIKLELLE